MNPIVTERLIAATKKARLAHQMIGVPGASGTDAWAMQLVRGGVASSVVSVPLRYMHTPIEVLDLGDLEAAAKLLATFCADLSPDTDFVPK